MAGLVSHGHDYCVHSYAGVCAMRIVLSGGERGSSRSILLANGVDHIALNVTQYAVPKKKVMDLAAQFNGAKVYVYSSDGDENVAKFDEFIRTNNDTIECVIGRPDYDGTWLGDKYIPIWNDPQDLERLAYLCEKVGRVAISDKAISAKTLPRIRQLQQRWGCYLVALTSKADLIEALPWDLVIVSSWTSVIRFGETQVWDMHGLRRYPAQKKESARKKHRADIVRLGVDFDAVMEDDVNEVAKLAIRSWMAWQEHTFGVSSAAYHPLGEGDEEEFQGSETAQIATIVPQNSDTPNRDFGRPDIATFTPEPRHESDMQLLPVMGVETIVSVGRHDQDSLEIDPHRDTAVKYINDGIRNCNSCYLAPKCPGFKADAVCVYRLPVELKTKEQLRAVLRAMLEMQTSRVLFARFAEELEGQGMDPALSHEMDRLFRLTKEFKDIEDTRDLVRFEMEAKGSSGVISRLFGSKAGETVNRLETPLSTRELDQVILDAHVLDEPLDSVPVKKLD